MLFGFSSHVLNKLPRAILLIDKKLKIRFLNKYFLESRISFIKGAGSKNKKKKNLFSLFNFNKKEKESIKKYIRNIDSAKFKKLQIKTSSEIVDLVLYRWNKKSIAVEVYEKKDLKNSILGKGNHINDDNLKKITEYERLKLQVLNENLLESWVILDGDTYIKDYNQSFSQLLDKEEDYISGKEFLSLVKNEDYELNKENLQDLITGKKIREWKTALKKDSKNTTPVFIKAFAYPGIGEGYQNIGMLIYSQAEEVELWKKLDEVSSNYNNLIKIYNDLSLKFYKCDSMAGLYSIIGKVIHQFFGKITYDIIEDIGTGDFKRQPVAREVLVDPDYTISGKNSTTMKILKTRGKFVYYRDIKTEVNDEDLKIYSGLSNFESAIFIPLYRKNKIFSVFILCFHEKIHASKDLYFSFLKGIVNYASSTIDRIFYVNEQQEIKTAMTRHEKLITMGQIIAGVAHEVNNPLSIIQLDIDELKVELKNLKISTEVQELIYSIQEEIERMSGIIKQLRDYARPEDFSIEGGETYSVDELFKTYPLKILIKSLQKKGIDIKLNLNTPRKRVSLSRNILLGILMNMISNASDALKGIDKPEISLLTYINEETPHRVTIKVKDNGCGISEENQQKIFDPFFTTKKGEGTGLGLSISYSAIRRSGGEIKVSSKLNENTTFFIEIPCGKRSVE